MTTITFDIEASDLLRDSSIDYTSSPYKLRGCFSMHCIVVEEHETGNIIAFYDGPTYKLDGRSYKESFGDFTFELKDYLPIEYIHRPLIDFPEYVKSGKVKKVIAHNGINYDLLVCKLWYGLDYTVEPDSWAELPLEIVDTLVLSKTLNPDRFGGHSLDNLGKKVGLSKINFRPSVPDSDKFKYFAADMLYYCIRDVQVNTRVYKWLEAEKQGWEWSDAISLEKSVAEIITRQEHRGFKFNKELAEENIKKLDQLMAERRERVSPLLPKKKATKAFMKDYTPPVRQFLKTGEPSSYLTKFAEKIGADIVCCEEGRVKALVFNGETYKVPMQLEPLLTEQDADIDDSTHIKDWLVGLGWSPSEYKEKDLTYKQVKGTGKVKRTEEEYEKAVNNYVEQTLNCSFKQDRLDHLKTNERNLKSLLLRKDISRSVKVLTNPNFTVGQEKELCPNLEKFKEDFPYVKDVVEYLTYKHRRNSILGGGLDWDEEEEADKGYMAYVREDGRIPTPADTCGAATSRFKHRIVANIPRVTSLFGKEMRALFGVDNGFYQVGYDFDSLEAREEAHYCMKYDPTKEYCNSLLMDKPNDVHTQMAKKISAIIKKEFGRSPAKSVKYACLPMQTKVLTKEGWKTYKDIKEGEVLISFNPDKGICEDDTVIKKHFFSNKEVFKYSNKYDSFECTEDHRWYGWKRTRAKGQNKIWGFTKAKDFVQENNILLTAPYKGGDSNILPHEAALVGWILADGYYKWSDKGEGTSCSFGKRKEIRCSISQSINKYWKELEECLKANNALFRVKEETKDNGNNVRHYYLKSQWVRPFFDRVLGERKNKHDFNWTKWVQELSVDSLDAFYEAFYMADGEMLNRNNMEAITQNLGNIFEAVVTAKQLLGRGRVKLNNKGSFNSRCRTIRTARKRHLTCQELKKTSLGVQDTFCLTTNNGTFIVWQDDFIGITGNCTYGATGPKVAKTIGSPLKVGEQVVSAFWEAASPLKKLKDRLQTYWETVGGKKFILGIDGRKVPTRSQHAILNSLFQSAGVICAKRAMVIYDKLLKETPYSVDFFKEDWREKTFISQLCAYHDEAQLEASKSLFTFKIFQGEEECKKFKQERLEKGEVWSDIGHTQKGYYVAHSIAGEIAVKAVKMAGEYYNLNVDLTAGYMVGRDWCECH